MTGQGQHQSGQGQGHSTEQMKKMFARQRAKDLAEHAKNMLSKDREIEDLRKKCQELADQLSNADFLGPEVRIRFRPKELLCMRKQAIWVPTRSDTNRAVQPQKMGRGLKFRM